MPGTGYHSPAGISGMVGRGLHMLLRTKEMSATVYRSVSRGGVARRVDDEWLDRSFQGVCSGRMIRESVGIMGGDAADGFFWCCGCD